MPHPAGELDRPRALRVGLTGGVASGKSTVSDLFAALGVPVIDADQVAREVVAPPSPLLAQIAARFGEAVLLADGSLDRRALRDVVFRDDEARRDLERLTHPAIRDRMWSLMRAAAHPYVIAAVPLLVEGELYRSMDRVLVVDVAVDVQIARLTSRDGVDKDAAMAIIDAQASRAARLAVADDVIDNSGRLEDLPPQVEALHQQYMTLAGGEVYCG